MRFPFIGPTYQSLSLIADAQRTVNLYPEVIESGTGKNTAALYGTPGLSLFTTLPTTPLRGLWVGESRLFAVAGSKLYEVFSNGGYSDLGDVENDGAPVQMFPNGAQLFIVSNGKVWVHTGTSLVQPQFQLGENTVDIAGTAVTWKTGDKFTSDMVNNIFTLWFQDADGNWSATDYTVASVTDTEHLVLTADAGTYTDVPTSARGPVTAYQGAFLDGYFIAMKAYGYRTFYHSALMDGLYWDGLDYANKEGYPDALAAILADHEDLWLFGTQTTEIWRNNYSTAPESFPWERDPGAFIHYGCIAPWTPVRLADGVAWLAGDPRGHAIAFRARGYQPQRISTHAIEQEWATYSTIGDAEGYSYTEAGHQFWVINFPTANKTWCYDATTNLWHERGWWNGASLDRQRGRCHAYVFGKHFLGDWENGKIYEASVALYDDFGGDIKRIRTAPHISDEEKRIFYHRFQLDAEAGVGLEPVLDWSNDGGKVWSSTHTPQNADVIGTTTHRFNWNRLGCGRDRVFRVTITGKKKVALVNAYLNGTPGQH